MRRRLAPLALALAAALGAAACSGAGATPVAGARSVVVTYAVLGAVVSDLVGAAARVTVLMPNGVDPHDWSPSAKDIEAVEKAEIVVANGLGLEASLEGALAEAAKKGVDVFRATDHVIVRMSGAATGGVAAAAGASGARGGAGDPHFWTDPISMRMAVAALAANLEAAGIDVGSRATDLEGRLDGLDAEVRATLAPVPQARRLLVTGHESMGYFADRYGFTLVGAVVPGLTSQGEVAAGQLADLKAVIEARGVKAIFAEIGTPASVVDAIARETGATVVQLPSHNLPPDGSYFSFIRLIAGDVAGALR